MGATVAIGVVVPVVVIAALVALGIFIWRKRSQKHPAYDAAPTSDQEPQEPQEKGPSELQSSPLYEMEDERKMQELGTNIKSAPYERHELSS